MQLTELTTLIIYSRPNKHFPFENFEIGLFFKNLLKMAYVINNMVLVGGSNEVQFHLN